MSTTTQTLVPDIHMGDALVIGGYVGKVTALDTYTIGSDARPSTWIGVRYPHGSSVIRRSPDESVNVLRT